MDGKDSYHRIAERSGGEPSGRLGGGSVQLLVSRMGGRLGAILRYGRLGELLSFALTIVAAIAGQQLLTHLLGISGRRAWRYLFGSFFVIWGAIVIWRREVPVGIDGRPPSHMSRGWAAALIGALVLLLGLAVLVVLDDNSFE